MRGFLVLAALSAALGSSFGQSMLKTDPKIVCYMDSRGFVRQGQGKFDVSFLESAMPFCTHLVYGYAGINKETFKMVPLNEYFDVTKDNYRHITDLKRRFPGLRVLLSVGGDADDNDDYDKYLELLESVDHRISFVNSAHTLIKTFGFDGLDLAWQFPRLKPKKIRNKFTKFFVGLKHKIIGESVVDDKEEEHKEQFTALVRETKNAFKTDGLLLTVSVLPNVNSTGYFDARAISQYVDFVNVWAFDFYNSKRNPKEADYPAPLYPLIDRKPYENGDYIIESWLKQGFPNNKLVFGIPTYGRSWKMTEDSAISGVPPFEVDEGGEEGPYTKQSGLLSFPEVCTLIANPNNLKGAGNHLRKVGDPSKRYGVYAFRLPDENENGGIWVGYEDPDSVGNKAAYAKAKGLGGVAMVDLSLDDFRGLCSGDKYPLLRAAKYRL